MSIYEYDQEEHIRLEREDAFEDGRKVGKTEGKAEGERDKLISQVKKKLAKGYTVEQIADALEETTDIIQGIVDELKD